MDRRHFIGSIAAAGLAPFSFADAEEQAAETVARLSRLDFPFARSLGGIRASRFYPLPQDLVRFEIQSSSGYHVGLLNEKTLEPVEHTVATSSAPLFHEITAHAFANAPSFEQQLRKGVPWWRARLDAASGIDVHGHNGIAAGDIDNDGLDEIYICQPGGLPNRLYKNDGAGQLTDITELAGVAVLDPTSSALFLDVRNSGHQDLVVLRPDGPLLLLNDGTGRFTHKPGAFRFRTPPQGSFTGMAAADYDRDGRLDLYLCTYAFFRDGNQYRYPTPYYDAQNGPANFLFHNNGDGAFTDVTGEVGLDHNNNRFSFAPAWCDYNGDGWPDLFVANDFGRKNLYRNDRGRFRDIAAEAGVEDFGDGMSAAWFDYDGDGRPDLYVSNMWSAPGQRTVAERNLQPSEPWRRHAKGNSLYRNKGDGTFEETGAREGVEMGRWAWSADGIDFDNDGTPEIFITCGMLTNSSEEDLESYFWRKVAAETSGPSYEDGWNSLSKAVHERFSEAGRQPNVFYVRRDGRYIDHSGVSGLDFADDSRAFAVTDLDGDGNLDLIVKSRLGPQVRVFQNNCAAGRNAIAFRLRGTKSNRDAIGARIEVDGQVKFVSAGSGYLSQHSKTIHFGTGHARLVRIDWPSGRRQEFRDLQRGRIYSIEEGSSEARAVPFKVRRELPSETVTGQNDTRFADTWLLQPVPLPEPFAGPGFLRLSNLSKEPAAQYSIFCRYLFDLRADVNLPVWFLADERGHARKIYFSPPDPEDLRRTASTPFAGRWYTPPERNYTALGAAFFAGGFPELALRYLELAPQDNAPVLFAIGKIHLEAKRWSAARDKFEHGLRLNPASPDGWNSLGAAKAGAGDLKAAIPNFQKAIEVRRDYTPAINNLAGAYAGAGQWTDAVAALRYGIQVVPNEETFYQNLAALYTRQGKTDEAEAVLQSFRDRR